MKRVLCSLSMSVLTLILAASAALADVSLPTSMKDIPIFAGSKVVAAMSQSEADMATFEVQDDAKKVKEFYKDALVKAGWKVEMEMENTDMALLSLSKGGAQLMMTVDKTDDKATYVLTLTKK